MRSPTTTAPAPAALPRFAVPAKRNIAGRTAAAPVQREKQSRDVVVPEGITVGELANRMAEKGADLVKALFKMGTPVTINDVIDQDTAELLVEEFGHRITRVSEADVEIDTSADVDTDESLEPRPPVVDRSWAMSIMARPRLLDALRGTDVVAGEAGGITQHIGAYQVTDQERRHHHLPRYARPRGILRDACARRQRHRHRHPGGCRR